MIGEGNQQRQTDDPAQPGQYPDPEPDHHAHYQRKQTRWFEQQTKRVPCFADYIRWHRWLPERIT